LFIFLQGIITIAIAIAYVLPTTTVIGGTPFNTHLLPHQRGATPHHDCNLAAVGQHHTPSATGEQSGDCKALSFQWKDGEDECIC